MVVKRFAGKGSNVLEQDAPWFQAAVLSQTEKAVWFRFDGMDEDTSIPKSCILDLCPQDWEAGDRVDVQIKWFMAQQKGLIE